MASIRGRQQSEPTRARAARSVPSGRCLLALCALVSLACSLPSLIAHGGGASGTGAQPTWTRSPPTVTPAVAVKTVSPTFTPTPSATAQSIISKDPQLSREGIQLFPWPLYAGDRLSVDVDPLFLGEAGVGSREQITVTLSLGDGQVFSADVAAAGLVDEPRARFYWVADLPDAAVATVLTVTLHLPPSVVDDRLDNNVVEFSVPLRSRTELDPPEMVATWAVTETLGFRLHYIAGSAAERDLAPIVLEARSAYTDVTSRLGEGGSPVEIYLLDRVIGQGGYASSDWVAISYVDRRYSPTSLGSVMRHELTHRLDGDIGCDGAPSVIREGLAVYLSGGHYRPEPLRARAAALLATPRYIPLETLVDGFYTHQHEAAYLEAGAVVQYLIDHFGWDALVDACAAASDAEGEDPERWGAALASLTISDTTGLATGWKAWLWSSGILGRDQGNLELELRLMDTMRAYQTAYDPAAHYLEGILFSPAEAERLGIVADFVRRPRGPEAIGMELVLAMAQEAAVLRDAALLEILIKDLDTALTVGVLHSEFVRDAGRIAALSLAQGWEPYHLLLEATGRYTVLVLDRPTWPERSVHAATRQNGAWGLSTLRLGE